MVIHAYYDDYVSDAQDTLGNMFEYGVNLCKIEPEHFFTMFLNSGLKEENKRRAANAVTLRSERPKS